MTCYHKFVDELETGSKELHLYLFYWFPSDILNQFKAGIVSSSIVESDEH